MEKYTCAVKLNSKYTSVESYMEYRRLFDNLEYKSVFTALGNLKVHKMSYR